MRIPDRPVVLWARRLQLAAALTLMAAPMLTWVHVPLFHHVVDVPGVFTLGLPILASGLVATAMCGFRIRMPGLQMLVAGTAACMAARAYHVISTRTEYQLERLQLSLGQANGLLTLRGLSDIQVSPTGWSHGDFVGAGLWLALGAAVVLAGAASVEAIGYAHRHTMLSALLGLPVCRACGHRLEYGMPFCSGCGLRLSVGGQCPQCRGWCRQGDRFCAQCGARTEVGDLAGPTESGLAG